MENLFKHSYHVSGMSCGGCITAVKNKLSTAPDVISVQVDLAKKEVEITSSKVIKAETLQDALKNSHYTITELRAA